MEAFNEYFNHLFNELQLVRTLYEYYKVYSVRASFYIELINKLHRQKRDHRYIEVSNEDVIAEIKQYIEDFYILQHKLYKVLKVYIARKVLFNCDCGGKFKLNYDFVDMTYSGRCNECDKHKRVDVNDIKYDKNMTYDDYRPTGSILISSFVTSDYTKEGNNQYKYL